MKPAVLLYNPPATHDPQAWIRPFPLNILSLCSVLDEKRYNLVVVQDFPEQAMAALLPHLDEALVLGISCKTGSQIIQGLEVAAHIRAARPGLPIIWGGFHPTALPEQTLRDDLVDGVVRGYGEHTFAELVERLDQGRDGHDLAGTSWLLDGQVVHNEDRPIPSLDDLPSMPYHLFDVERFFSETRTRSLHYVSSRGCPHRCGFCADCAVYRQRWNPLSAERVLDDLERLQRRYGFDTVRFYDSNLLVSEQRTVALCEGALSRGLRFGWDNCNGDAHVLARYADSTLALMARTGFSKVLLGMESAYEPALELIDKAATTEENLIAVERLHRHGISIGYSFMFGFPYDLPLAERREAHRQELLSTARLLARLSQEFIPGDYCGWFVYTPYPGVRLFPLYVRLGYQPPVSFRAWSEVNLDRTNSSPWVEETSLAAFDEALQLKWYFMHELARNLAGENGPRWQQRLAERLDARACRLLTARVARGEVRVPLALKLLQYGVMSLRTIRLQGLRGYLAKLRLILRTDSREKRFLRRLFG